MYLNSQSHTSGIVVVVCNFFIDEFLSGIIVSCYIAVIAFKCDVDIQLLYIAILSNLTIIIIIYQGGPYFAAEVFGPHMRSRGPNTSGGVQIFHA